MSFYGYIGSTPITAYGCVLCQTEHRMGIDPEYQDHLYRQSKHGVYRRGPLDAEEQAVAQSLAAGAYPAHCREDHPVFPIRRT